VSLSQAHAELQFNVEVQIPNRRDEKLNLLVGGRLDMLLRRQPQGVKEAVAVEPKLLLPNQPQIYRPVLPEGSPVADATGVVPEAVSPVVSTVRTAQIKKDALDRAKK